MTGTQLKLTLGLSGVLLLGGAMALGLWRGRGGELSPEDVSQRAQREYASLTSYSDEGTTCSTLNGTTITRVFTIRLARPNLCRIAWEQTTESDGAKTTDKQEAIWSAGEGCFMETAGGTKKRSSLELTLNGATGISGGVTATVPGTFFNMNWGNPLRWLASINKRQADEKVGEVDCYVYSCDLGGSTRTLWIGKRDFLIRQVRDVSSAQAASAALAESAKRHPEIAALRKPRFHDFAKTETHTNIVVNQKYSATDFAR